MDRLLPIGSVIHTKNANCYTMILGYCKPVEEENTVNWYDYAGCIYPIGYMDVESTVVFNEEDIDKVIFEGFSNEKYTEREKEVRDFLSSVRNGGK